nr:tRNA-binding protein [Saprospiraceae bacterium]
MPTPIKPLVTYDKFAALDIRTGTIVAAEPFSEVKKPAYKMTIDFGPLGHLKSSAQITLHYKPEELVGKKIVAVVNFPPKQIANTMSECLVLGVLDAQGGVKLLCPDGETENGSVIA